ncbi:MAG: F0F1 ATP synthase subunit B [Pseudomonadales bacterium]
MNINATMIGQMLTFVVFVWFCMKFIWPPITSALAERKKKIADGLSAADRAEQDLELAKEKATQQLKEAKQQGAEIIEQANKRATQLVEEAKEQAREEGERLLVAAQAEIEQEFNRAREELRTQVAAVAVAGAEKVLGAKVDAAEHSAMLDKLAAEL